MRYVGACNDGVVVEGMDKQKGTRSGLRVEFGWRPQRVLVSGQGRLRVILGRHQDRWVQTNMGILGDRRAQGMVCE